MKRTILLFLVALMCMSGFAEEISSSADVTYKTTTGGFFFTNKDTSGGFGEFGIKLCDEANGFVLRNCIFFEGFGTDLPHDISYGAAGIGDKLIIGGRTNGLGFIVRSYGYIGGSFDLYKGGSHEFFDSPYLCSFNMGGGFEFQYTTENAFVVEFGGICRGPVGAGKDSFTDYAVSGPSLTIGFRSFR